MSIPIPITCVFEDLFHLGNTWWHDSKGNLKINIDGDQSWMITVVFIRSILASKGYHIRKITEFMATEDGTKCDLTIKTDMPFKEYRVLDEKYRKTGSIIRNWN